MTSGVHAKGVGCRSYSLSNLRAAGVVILSACEIYGLTLLASLPQPSLGPGKPYSKGVVTASTRVCTPRGPHRAQRNQLDSTVCSGTPVLRSG